METDNRIIFSLESIQEESFALEDVAVASETLRVQYLIESEIHPDKESVLVRSGVRYMMDERIICECVISIKFAIVDFHSVVSIDDDSKVINFTSNLVPTFLSITYGALRGALFERVKNTQMESFPLPLISMQELEKSNHFKVIR